jgi:hypothetical protein
VETSDENGIVYKSTFWYQKKSLKIGDIVSVMELEPIPRSKIYDYEILLNEV